MNKLLLVGRNRLFMESLKATCEDMFDTVICSSHEDALASFVCEEPSHVVICDCDRGLPGIQTHKDITLSATEQHILRCGFSRSDEPDYLQLPFLIKDLKEKLS